jgi:hypothetical protein
MMLVSERPVYDTFHEVTEIPGLKCLYAARWGNGSLWGTSGGPDNELELVAALGLRSSCQRPADRQDSQLTPDEQRASQEAVADFIAEAKRDEKFSFAIVWRIDGDATVHLDHSHAVSRELAESIVLSVYRCPYCGHGDRRGIEGFDWTKT